MNARTAQAAKLNPLTITGIRTCLEMDATLTPAMRVKIVDAIEGAVGGADGNALDKCVTFTEAAKVLGKSRKRIQQLVANGSLEAVKFPGSSRASGVRESSLRRLVNG